MNAYNDRKKDEDFDLHRQVWLSEIVKNRDENGKPMFEKFSDFYNDEEPEELESEDVKTLKVLAEFNNKRRRGEI